jgi:shikimate kinase
MNVVLIGYRGTGKSSVGKLLAERSGRTLVSTDAEVVRRAGQSIPEIVKQQGWDHFRDLESDVCRDLAGKDQLIIDTGGGAILRQDNVDRLKAGGILFWLTAEVPTISRRIGGDTQRPSLTGAKSFIEEIEEVLRERTPKYKAAADHVIATDGRTVVEIADAIQALLQTSQC